MYSGAAAPGANFGVGLNLTSMVYFSQHPFVHPISLTLHANMVSRGPVGYQTVVSQPPSPAKKDDNLEAIDGRGGANAATRRGSGGTVDAWPY